MKGGDRLKKAFETWIVHLHCEAALVVLVTNVLVKKLFGKPGKN